MDANEKRGKVKQYYKERTTTSKTETNETKRQQCNNTKERENDFQN